MSNAVRDLSIPIGIVLASPIYRARETVRLAGLENSQSADELGDRGRSMQGVTEADGAWLQDRVKELPTGTNTMLVTHLPNISRAFPQHASGLADGDALVFGPDGKGGVMLVARITIAEWPTLR